MRQQIPIFCLAREARPGDREIRMKAALRPLRLLGGKRHA